MVATAKRLIITLKRPKNHERHQLGSKQALNRLLQIGSKYAINRLEIGSKQTPTRLKTDSKQAPNRL